MFRRHIAGLESPWFDRRRFKSIFDPPKPSLPPAVPQPGSEDSTDEEIETARRRTRQARQRRSGLSGTILTGGLGDTSGLPARRKTLLGE